MKEKEWEREGDQRCFRKKAEVCNAGPGQEEPTDRPHSIDIFSCMIRQGRKGGAWAVFPSARALLMFLVVTLYKDTK